MKEIGGLYFSANSGSSFCRIGSIPLHQTVVFHDEGARCVLSPRGIVLFHQIIAQCGSIPQLHQPVGFLKGNLLHEAERSVRGRQQHAHMPDEQRVLRLGKPVMQNDRDQPCAAVRKGHTARRPARLQRRDLLCRLRAVRSRHRRKQRTKLGTAVPAEHSRVSVQRRQIEKERILPLCVRLVCSGCDKCTKQPECR